MEKNCINTNISSKYEADDTIIVPSDDMGFKYVFIREQCWFAVKIRKERIQHIKYLAIYRKNPICSITHYARVKKIEPFIDDTNKSFIHFIENSIVELDQPLTFESPYNAVRRPIYTNLKKLLSSKKIEDLK